MDKLQVADIILALRRIEAVTAGAASRAPRSALSGAATFLEQYSALTVDEVENQLQLSKPKPPPKKPAAPLREQLVRKYADQLSSAGTDLPVFEDVIARLGADKTARVQEVKAIAKEYGASFTSKVRIDGLNAIRQKFDERWKLANRSVLKAS
ncbi:hypothetical protein ACQKH5_11830 [Hyphomonas sp. NPDC076900]|uniref:hypothetical protein n=1 Tax=unclassified Hyphomonas TaxID=2630699 RepID=UPI003D07A6CF